MLDKKRLGDMKFEIQEQAANSVPALFLAGASAITMNAIIGIVTVFYILLQAAYLIWKWHREASFED